MARHSSSYLSASGVAAPLGLCSPTLRRVRRGTIHSQLASRCCSRCRVCLQVFRLAVHFCLVFRTSGTASGDIGPDSPTGRADAPSDT